MVCADFQSVKTFKATNHYIVVLITVTNYKSATASFDEIKNRCFHIEIHEFKFLLFTKKNHYLFKSKKHDLLSKCRGFH